MISSQCTPPVTTLSTPSLTLTHAPRLVAFLLAANVVLEIEGETSDIQQHFSTSSTSASASVGFGPFSVSSSASSSNTSTDSTCESTASGCRSVSSIPLGD